MSDGGAESFEPDEIDFEQGIIFGKDVLAFRRCPKCGRYLRISEEAIMIVNGLDEVIRIEGFTCSKCGDVEPSWMRTA